MIKIKKIKFDNVETHIVFTKKTLENKNPEELTLKTSDIPLEVLTKKLQSLSKYIINICELSRNADIKVTGISFSFSHDITGAVIIGQNKLLNSTGVVNIVTPHRIEDFYSEHGDKGQLMPSGMADDVKELELLIIDFVNGARVKQQDLFNETTR